ncbi:FtsB family cell division protein [Actinopolymorpha singaporensis]|uniref:FtsB family cell division protein n=1 Tax=Actinopolymorpha singaporensis TaxID=117157 RepID=UPI003BAE35C3
MIAALVISYASSLRAWVEQRSQIAALRTEETQRTERVASLEKELRRWHDPAYVEAQARERLRWVKPGGPDTSSSVRTARSRRRRPPPVAPPSARGPSRPGGPACGECRALRCAADDAARRQDAQHAETPAAEDHRPQPHPDAATEPMTAAPDPPDPVDPDAPVDPADVWRSAPSWAGRPAVCTASRTGAGADCRTSWRPSRGCPTVRRSRPPSTSPARAWLPRSGGWRRVG